jgi:hypothetical protein
MRVFLLTSFPTLAFEAPAPLGVDEVITRCADHLSAGDIADLEAICGEPPEGSSTFARELKTTWSIFQAWNRKERTARLPSVSEETGVSSAAEPDSQLRHDLEEAWSATNPLSREKALLKAEWNWLEAKRRAAPYSLTDLFGYVLQLRLLERKDQWEEAAGEIQFTAHVRSFIDPVLEDLVTQEAHA